MKGHPLYCYHRLTQPGPSQSRYLVSRITEDYRGITLKAKVGPLRFGLRYGWQRNISSLYRDASTTCWAEQGHARGEQKNACGEQRRSDALKEAPPSFLSCLKNSLTVSAADSSGFDVENDWISKKISVQTLTLPSTARCKCSGGDS